MVNVLWLAKDCKHDAEFAQEPTEYAHAALKMAYPDMSSDSRTQWEIGSQKSSVNDRKRGAQHALTSMESDAWMEYRLANHSWYTEDPIWMLDLHRVGVLKLGCRGEPMQESGNQLCGHAWFGLQ